MNNNSDADLYSEVLEHIKKELGTVYNCSENVYILAISRKGPRMLECILGCQGKQEALENLNVITELSLPFFFNELKNRQQRSVKVYLFDDAIYFGTTFESVYKELETYARFYGIEIEIVPVTGIITAEAKESFPFRVKTVKREIRKGYGHYYIRRLTEGIRKLRQPFELEFPIVHYHTDGIDFGSNDRKERLVKELKSQFGESKVYEIGYNYEDEYSITVLLNSGDDITAIKKLRIYPSGDGRVAISCLSPHTLPDAEETYQKAWGTSDLQQIWTEIYDSSLPTMDIESANVKRNHHRTLVMMYSYLNSFKVLLNHIGKIVAALTDAGDEVVPKYDGFYERDLFYLLGDKKLTKRMTDWLNRSYLNHDVTKAFVRRAEEYPASPVFEMADFPSPQERKLLEFKNIEGIKKCNSVQQALSVVFFNQNCLIEKWSRRQSRYDHQRLRFGQTYESIFQIIKAQEGLGSREDTMRAVNQWIDRRIDQGCIVPQYVKSIEDNRWYRVFRSGENEDAILSHLARFALMVFAEAKNIMDVKELPERDVELLLQCPFVKEMQILEFSKEIGVPLLITDKIQFHDDDMPLKEYTPLVEYLVNTGVLEKHKDMINVSETLGDDDLQEVTTLCSETEEKYRKEVSRPLNDMRGVDRQQDYTVFNFYMIPADDARLSSHESVLNDSASQSDNLMVAIERSIRQSEHISPSTMFNLMLNGYVKIRSMAINEMYWMDNPDRLKEMSDDEGIRERIVSLQQKLLQLRAVDEFILYCYVYSDYGSLLERSDYYTKRKEQRSALFGGLKDVLEELCNEDNFNRNVWDRHTVLKIRSFINNVIKYPT